MGSSSERGSLSWTLVDEDIAFGAYGGENPGLEFVFNFGNPRIRGKTLEEVVRDDRGYLIWAIHENRDVSGWYDGLVQAYKAYRKWERIQPNFDAGQRQIWFGKFKGETIASVCKPHLRWYLNFMLGEDKKEKPWYSELKRMKVDYFVQRGWPIHHMESDDSGDEEDDGASLKSFIVSDNSVSDTDEEEDEDEGEEDEEDESSDRPPQRRITKAGDRRSDAKNNEESEGSSESTPEEESEEEVDLKFYLDFPGGAKATSSEVEEWSDGEVVAEEQREEEEEEEDGDNDEDEQNGPRVWPLIPYDDPGSVLLPFGRSYKGETHKGKTLTSILNADRGYIIWCMREHRSHCWWHEGLVRNYEQIREWEARTGKNPGSRKVWFGRYKGQEFRKLYNSQKYKRWVLHPRRKKFKWYNEIKRWHDEYRDQLARYRSRHRSPRKPRVLTGRRVDLGDRLGDWDDEVDAPQRGEKYQRDNFVVSDEEQSLTEPFLTEDEEGEESSASESQHSSEQSSEEEETVSPAKQALDELIEKRKSKKKQLVEAPKLSLLKKEEFPSQTTGTFDNPFVVPSSDPEENEEMNLAAIRDHERPTVTWLGAREEKGAFHDDDDDEGLGPTWLRTPESTASPSKSRALHQISTSHLDEHDLHTPTTTRFHRGLPTPLSPSKRRKAGVSSSDSEASIVTPRRRLKRKGEIEGMTPSSSSRNSAPRTPPATIPRKERVGRRLTMAQNPYVKVM